MYRSQGFKKVGGLQQTWEHNDITSAYSCALRMAEWCDRVEIHVANGDDWRLSEVVKDYPDSTIVPVVFDKTTGQTVPLDSPADACESCDTAENVILYDVTGYNEDGCYGGSVSALCPRCKLRAESEGLDVTPHAA